MKQRVVFYLLNQQNNSPFLFACRFLEKAFKQQHRVIVQTNNNQESEQLNELLWTYKDISFVPHHLYNEQIDSPIVISHVDTVAQDRDLLVNLTDKLPAHVEHYAHIVEIVGTTTHAKQVSREKYKQYREQGCELETHNI